MKNFLIILYNRLGAVLKIGQDVLKSDQDGILILKRIDTTVQLIRTEQVAMRQVIDEILAAAIPPPAVGFVFSVELEGETFEGATNINMTNSQKATATITPVFKDGTPAPVDGVPVWASSDETIVTVAPAADGLSAVVAAVGPLGSAKISVTGDADLGADVKPIFGSLDVSITQGLAVGFKIVLGDPVEQ